MNIPRVLACLAATGLLAASLSGQSRGGGSGTGRTTTSSTPAPTPMPDSSAVVGRTYTGSLDRGTGFAPAPDRNRPVGTSSTNPVPHGVAVVGARPHGRAFSGDFPHYRHPGPYVYAPNALWWAQRDILFGIQSMAREGFVPCTLVADDALEVSDYADFPSGWKGYAFVVPPKGTLHVSLNHVNRGWFRLVMMNKWGNLQEGMLQNLIPTGNPEVTFKNPKDEAQAVYVVADDPGWMSSKAYPYQLTVQRSWEPGTFDAKSVQVAVGVWGNHLDMSAQFRRPTWVGFGSWDRRGMGWW